MERIETDIKYKRRKRVKLIFNPGSGVNRESPVQLMNIIKELQKLRFMPEPFITEPDCDLKSMAEEAISQGIKLFVVCGGDGTVSAAAGALTGMDCVMGIIPTGTQNNIAYSLGIPSDIKESVSLLRFGRQVKIDMGMAVCGEKTNPFIEMCSVGLFSSVFPAADDIQHGKIFRIGDLLAAFNGSEAAQINIVLNNKYSIEESGHVVIISNMPYIGRHFRFGNDNAYKDGLLNVIFYSNLSKLDLIGCALKGPGIDNADDPRIRHYLADSIDISTVPVMTVMTDGNMIGEGNLHIEIKRKALAVITGEINKTL